MAGMAEVGLGVLHVRTVRGVGDGMIDRVAGVLQVVAGPLAIVAGTGGGEGQGGDGGEQKRRAHGFFSDDAIQTGRADAGSAGLPGGGARLKAGVMRLAFLGTPDFAVVSLAAIVEAGFEVACVYSQPPAPRGRGKKLSPSPVQAFAEAHGLAVRTPASMREPAEIAAFEALGLDAAVVVAFGQILPREVIDAPRLGTFNLHASLLPRWRGAAPIQRAIIAGDRQTGVGVMRL